MEFTYVRTRYTLGQPILLIILKAYVPWCFNQNTNSHAPNVMENHATETLK
jgi:hypothetical protein